MIKNVIFDLSEVIVSGYVGVEEIVAKRTAVSAEEFLRRKTERLEVFFDAMRGKMSEEEYFLDLLSGVDFGLGVTEMKELVRENMGCQLPGTMEVVRDLNESYRLVLLSDHIREWIEYIFAKNPDLEIFDSKYFSYEFGKLKSEEGVFEEVLLESGFNRSETIFIDDFPKNLEVAEAVGVRGVLFRDAKDLRAELDKLGIMQKNR